MEEVAPLSEQHTTAGWISLIVGLLPYLLWIYAQNIAVLFFDASSYNFSNIGEIEHTKFILWFIPSVVLTFIGINLGIESKTTIAKIGLALNILIGIVLLVSGVFQFLLWDL